MRSLQPEKDGVKSEPAALMVGWLLTEQISYDRIQSIGDKYIEMSSQIASQAYYYYYFTFGWRTECAWEVFGSKQM